MIDTTILAVYTKVSDAYSVHMWLFPERKSTLFAGKRELLRFQITQHMADQLPDEIVHFEFRILEDTTLLLEVEAGGFWTYFHPGTTFSGKPRLFLVSDEDGYVQNWKKRNGL